MHTGGDCSISLGDDPCFAVVRRFLGASKRMMYNDHLPTPF